VTINERITSRDGRIRVDFHGADGDDQPREPVITEVASGRVPRVLVDLRGSGWIARGMFNLHDEKLTLYLYATPRDAMGLEAEFDFAAGSVRVVRRERDGAPIIPGRTFGFSEFARRFGSGGPEFQKRRDMLRAGTADSYWESD
jgi:hypothetical protein